MSASYIIRLDDACNTSDLNKWKAIEEILDEFDVKPVVAVIPDNQDSTLKFESENTDFWQMIKRWEEKGWAIAMHGYQHKYHFVNKRRLVLPYYDRSEFGGLSLEDQQNKIRKSLDIFRANHIEPKLWVAPGHSFDEVTLEALRREVPFRLVSDGIAFQPYSYKGFTFVPQQLWSIVEKKFGTWTICLHPDTMSLQDINVFKVAIAKGFIRDNLISLGQVSNLERRKGLASSVFSAWFWFRYRLVSFIKKIGKNFENQ